MVKKLEMRREQEAGSEGMRSNSDIVYMAVDFLLCIVN